MSKRRSASRATPIRLTDEDRQQLTFLSVQEMGRAEIKSRLNRLGCVYRISATGHELRWLLLGLKEQESDHRAAARRRSPKKRGKRGPIASGVAHKKTPEKLTEEGKVLMRGAAVRPRG